MSKNSSSRRQRRYDPLMILSYIVRYQRQYPGASPSQRRIRADLNISVPSVVHSIVHRLEGQGLLTITPHGRGVSADLTVTEEGRAAVQEWRRRQTNNGSQDSS